MGSAFHQLWGRYSGTLTPTAPTAIRLWDTFFLPAWEMAVHITAADDVFGGTNVVLSFPTGVLGGIWDSGHVGS